MEKRRRNNERLKQWRDRRKHVNTVATQNCTSSDESENAPQSNVPMLVAIESPSDNDIMFSDNDSHGVGSGVDYGENLIVDEPVALLAPRNSESNTSAQSETDNDCLDDEMDYALCERLKTWALNNNCTRACVNEILGIVTELGGNVPKDTRTLLNTKRDVIQTPMGVGHYIYIGVKNRICKLLSYQDNFQPIALFVNIDGLPIYKSSSANLWPILIRFHPFKPIAVAFFCGKSKPPFNQFVRDFVAEVKDLIRNGFFFNGVHRSVTLFCLPCDAPARSGLRGTIQHTGYWACERCTIRGDSIKNRIVYDRWDPDVDAPIEERTNEVFRQDGYSIPDDDGKRHQLDVSEFVDLPIDMIKNFPVDPMHLVYLGVTRRLLYYLKGSFRKIKDGKLSSAYMKAINQTLDNLKLPSEFARQPRSISDLDRWKAT
eukprot:TCONS_00024074-protein